MEKKEKEAIRAEIEKRISETKRSIASLREQAKPVSPDRAIGRLTRMDAIQQKSMSEANLRTQEQVLINLEEALSKLDEPDFGRCVRCSQAIPLGRILIVPESKCCVKCAAG